MPGAEMGAFSEDIYTEPSNVDVDTLKNLGPLTGLAGVWQGERGTDLAPSRAGSETSPFVERIELQPLDPQTSGPQLLYGLRYHQHVKRPGQTGTFHDQLGYFLWEPATGIVIQTLAIPRAQIAMAFGNATKDAKEFELVAKGGDANYGILSNPFLDYGFRTIEYRIKVSVNDDGTWGYDEDTVMMIRGRSEPFHHRDRSKLFKVAEPTPNPLALLARG